MSNRHCCYGACTSDSRIGRPGYDSSVKFYRFPQPCLLLRNNVLTWTNSEEKTHIPTCEKCKLTHAWMIRCKRSDVKFRAVRQITYGHFICSKHFDDAPAKMDYTKYLPKNNTISESGRNRRQRMDSRRAAVNGVGEASILDDIVVVEGEEEMEPVLRDVSTEEGGNDLFNQIDATSLNASTIVNSTNEPSVETRTTSTQTTWSYCDLDCQISILNSKIKRLEHELTLSKKARAISQLPLVAFEAQLEKNDEMCKFYTGFTNCQLNAFKTYASVEKINYWGTNSAQNNVDTSVSTARAPLKRRTYTQGQELLLFFMRLRGGFLLDDTGFRFGLSPSFISRIVTTWIQVLYEKFNSVRPLMFPSREKIQEFLPARFRKFKNIRVIIDCAEIRCEKASSFEQQGNCYSEYKAHTTHKFLIGCTPNGAVSFVSDLMEGSIHDREIVAQSGLIDLLSEGDLVLADRGFTIRDMTDEKGAILKIPAFLKGRDRLTPQEEIETKEIAANRIFVEHVVGRLKNFRIFQRVIPQSMRPVLSQAVFVCACLLNYHEPLVV